MSGERLEVPLDRKLFISVLIVIRYWAARDYREAIRRRTMTYDRTMDRLKSSRSGRDAAYEELRQELHSPAYDHICEELKRFVPSEVATPGAVARRWQSGKPLLADARAIVRQTVEIEERSIHDPAEGSESTEKLRAAVRSRFDQDFLKWNKWLEEQPKNGVASADDIERWRAEFIQEWAARELEDERLDLAQAGVVGATTHDLRVVARAGSGKTRALVTRALFLQLHCGVDPGEIMLIAFNRKAVGEIRMRLTDALPEGERLPHVVTFHALAYALLQPGDDLVFDDEDAETYAQSGKVQEVIDDMLQIRPADVRNAMLGHFTDDWKRILLRGVNLSKDEFFAARSETAKVTLAGEYVKSAGERFIANLLFENDVDYRYECAYLKGGFNYRPDFTVFHGKKPVAVIEYFGITGDPEYVSEADRKRRFWRGQRDVRFVEITPADLASAGPDAVRERVLTELEQAGVTHRSLSLDEVWARVRRRAVDTFSKAVKNFVSRARQLNLSGDALRSRASDGAALTEEAASFIDLAIDVCEEYLERAERDGFEDFAGLMWRATEAVANGQTAWERNSGRDRGELSKIRFIHIDEFQDFSAMFMSFIRAIREQAPEARLCCVGDDWQAINGFAGADLRYFNGFETDFPGARTRELVTNYRSGSRIVAAGNAVMAHQGVLAVPGQMDPGSTRLASLETFSPSPSEQARFPGDIGTPALLRLISRGLSETPGQVIVLFRSNRVPWYVGKHGKQFGSKLDGYLAFIRSHLPEDDAERVDVSTTHKYKGREGAFVIVAGADRRWYPLIHPTAELSAVFGDTVASLTADERRLFYVATTRAEAVLCYLVTSKDESPFLEPIRTSLAEISWSSIPPTATSIDEAQVEIVVYDAFEVKEQLKDPFGFKWDAGTKTWRVLRPAKDFDFAAVRQVLVFVGSRLIEVRNDHGRVIHRAGQRETPGRAEDDLSRF